MNKLIQTLWTMRGGVHPEFNKEASTQQPIQTLPIPPLLIIPLQQAMGVVPRLIVAVGDEVLKGQPLTSLAANSLGAIIHTSTSGVIIDIKQHALPHPSGMSGMCVFIETDGLDRCVETARGVQSQASCHENKSAQEKLIDRTPNDKTMLNASVSADYKLDYQLFPPDVILQKIESAGIVGLGGAAFPSATKLAAAGQKSIDTLIINAAECEPYISCDDALMRERASEIIEGINILMQLLQIEKCLIGIEDNKPEAIEALGVVLSERNKDQRSKDHHAISVKVVPTQYPSGDARQLTQLLTGIEIPKGKHALESGVLCHNIATAYAVYQSVVLHQPLLSRIVTIAGDGVKQPRNVEALLGTPISYIIEQLGGYTKKAERMIMGGPMMGFALPSDELPIVKATNCILVISKAQLRLASKATASDEIQAMPCIRCNKCAEVCPVNLLPQQLYWHARAHDFEKTAEHHLMDCIECGACSYVCPSYIPLVDYFRFAKTEIKSQQQATLKSSKSRERFEFNELRKQRIKQERDAKRQQHKEALMKKKADELAAKALLDKAGDNSGKNAANNSAHIVASNATVSAAEPPKPDTEKLAKQDAIKAAMERAKAKKAAMKAAEQKDSNRDAV